MTSEICFKFLLLHTQKKCQEERDRRNKRSRMLTTVKIDGYHYIILIFYMFKVSMIKFSFSFLFFFFKVLVSLHLVNLGSVLLVSGVQYSIQQFLTIPGDYHNKCTP